jgi:curved DNA-binding protein CbpA
MSEDYHAILGLRRDAGADEIRAAYRTAAKRAHPDQGGSSEAFQLVRTAADVLLAAVKAGGLANLDRSFGTGDRTSLEGDWMTVTMDLRTIWGMASEPVTVFAPQKIGLSDFTNGNSLNAPAFDWLTRTLGPRGETWDFHIAGSVTRIFFRRADDARLFQLRFY